MTVPVRIPRRRSTTRILVGITLLMSVAMSASAQWQTRTLPPGATGGVFPYESASGRTLLVAGGNATQPVLYRSTDDGISWTSSTMSNLAVSFATRPKSVAPASGDSDLYGSFIVGGDYFSGIRCELRRSVDGGSNWSSYAPPSQGCNFTFDPVVPEVFYATGFGESGPAYAGRTTDGGATWVNVEAKLGYWIYQLRVGPDRALYAMDADLYVSRDQGETWMKLPLRAQAGAPVYDVLAQHHLVYGDGYVLAATGNGLSMSIDAGLTWQAAGLQGFEIKSLDSVPAGTGEPMQAIVGYRGGTALLGESKLSSLSMNKSYYSLGLAPNSLYLTTQGTVQVCNNLSSCVTGTLPQAATLVEFHNARTDHYFMTLEGAESTAIDQGLAGAGWSRTGVAFSVFADERAEPFSVQPACRFYGTPGIGPDSHFYTLDQRECTAVQKDPGWTLETTTAFAATTPQVVNVSAGNQYGLDCGIQQPVYRFYNNRFAQNDSNHRYVSDPGIYQTMVSQGWKLEGIQFCIPR